MAIIKNHLADAFVKALPDDVRALLVYGPDAGLVSERTGLAVSAFLHASRDPLAHVRLTDDELRRDPARLADEVMAIAMFGGRRAIHVQPAGSDIAANLAALAGRIAADTLVVVEAGDLRPTSALRKLFEKTAACAAIPCYADSERDIGRLIDEEMRATGLRLDADARAFLSRLLGGDRLASRLELAKLALYAHGSQTVGIDDVRAIVGDASMSSLDELVDAVGLGDVADADRATQRYLRAGMAPADMIGATLRHFVVLHELRCRVEAGGGAREAIDGIRPPIFFKRKDAVARQCDMWTAQRLGWALDILHDGERRTRTLGIAPLAADCAGRALLEVAAGARSDRGDQRPGAKHDYRM